jgi:hypothetical protein
MVSYGWIENMTQMSLQRTTVIYRKIKRNKLKMKWIYHSFSIISWMSFSIAVYAPKRAWMAAHRLQYFSLTANSPPFHFRLSVRVIKISRRHRELEWVWGGVRGSGKGLTADSTHKPQTHPHSLHIWDILKTHLTESGGKEGKVCIQTFPLTVSKKINRYFHLQDCSQTSYPLLP